MIRRKLAYLAILAAVAVLYFVGGKLGLSLAFVNVSASAVWPPTGIALAALIALGYRVWPAIFVGAFLVNVTTSGSVAVSAGIAAGNTLEGIVGAYLVNRFAGGRHAFSRAQDVFMFALLAGMLATTVSATVGVASLSLGGLAASAECWRVWLTWWLGDATGALIVAPVALLWYLDPRLRWDRRKFLEGTMLLLAVAVTGLTVFGGLLPSVVRDYPVTFFCIPLLVWIATRFGQRETATATLLLSAIAAWGTLSGFGPMVRGSQHESLLLLQAFMGVVAIMAMGLSAALSERQRLEAHLVHLAEHDPLTDLLSRRGFHAELRRQLAEVNRYGVRGSLLFLDMDDFKRVNDTLGHAAGDQVLNGVGARLRARLRDSDLLARLGGDEFAILLPHTDDVQARALAAQLLDAIRGAPIAIDGQPVAVSASIGIALFPAHGRGVDQLLGAADAAMYRAKFTGGNRFCVWSAELDRAPRPTDLDPQRVREAFESGRSRLYGQPVLDLRRNRVSQYELSLYLDVGGESALSPATWLAAAELSGVARDIDRWTVTQAIGLLRQTPARSRAPQLSVNLSAMALSDGELMPAIQRGLREAAVDPRRLVLEIRELAALADAERAREFVDGVKGLGCQVALDHFGVGFFSLTHLKRLPVDYLKIDEQLVRDLDQDLVDRHLVEAIVEVSRALGPQTVGEGVGDEGTVQLLRECGVDYAEGPHVGAPQAITELWLAT